MDRCECCGDKNVVATTHDGRQRARKVCTYCRDDHGYRPEAHEDEE